MDVRRQKIAAGVHEYFPRAETILTILVQCRWRLASIAVFGICGMLLAWLMFGNQAEKEVVWHSVDWTAVPKPVFFHPNDRLNEGKAQNNVSSQRDFQERNLQEYKKVTQSRSLEAAEKPKSEQLKINTSTPKAKLVIFDKNNEQKKSKMAFTVPKQKHNEDQEMKSNKLKPTKIDTEDILKDNKATAGYPTTKEDVHDQAKSAKAKLTSLEAAPLAQSYPIRGEDLNQTKTLIPNAAVVIQDKIKDSPAEETTENKTNTETDKKNSAQADQTQHDYAEATKEVVNATKTLAIEQITPSQNPSNNTETKDKEEKDENYYKTRNLAKNAANNDNTLKFQRKTGSAKRVKKKKIHARKKK